MALVIILTYFAGIILCRPGVGKLNPGGNMWSIPLQLPVLDGIKSYIFFILFYPILHFKSYFNKNLLQSGSLYALYWNYTIFTNVHVFSTYPSVTFQDLFPPVKTFPHPYLCSFRTNRIHQSYVTTYFLRSACIVQTC